MRALLRETKRNRQATSHAEDSAPASGSLTATADGVRARQRAARGPGGAAKPTQVAPEAARNSMADRLAKIAEGGSPLLTCSVWRCGALTLVGSCW